MMLCVFYFFFSSRRRHTRLQGDWSSDVCSSDLQFISARDRRSAISYRLSAIGDQLLEMLMPALDSVFVIIAIGSSDSFGVLFAWKAASSWLIWLVLLLLEVLLELLSASLDEAWA